jgi:hypothetical protein
VLAIVLALAPAPASAPATVGCAATEEDGLTRAGATLLGTFDPNLFCDMVGVVTIEVVATRVGCVPGPPAPCTLPAEPEPIAGDRISCPVTDPSIALGVDLTEPGRYRLEGVGELTTGEQVRRCFSTEDEGGGEGEAEVELDQAAIDAGEQVAMRLTAGSCP